METATKSKDVYTCLLISLFWCDVLNFISGIAWIFLGLARYGYNPDPVLRFGGLVLVLVNLISMLFTCCGKYLSRGPSSDSFWFRVFMFPGELVNFSC